jgi:hypothetical protein
MSLTDGSSISVKAFCTDRLSVLLAVMLLGYARSKPLRGIAFISAGILRPTKQHERKRHGSFGLFVPPAITAIIGRALPLRRIHSISWIDTRQPLNMRS